MTRVTVWLTIVILGGFPIAACGQTAGAPLRPGTLHTPYQSDPPTYAIRLVDGRTAILWWDARTDPGQPHWVCEVPAGPPGATASVTNLVGARSDWRAALESATAHLKARELVADGE